jgi:predicted permease
LSRSTYAAWQDHTRTLDALGGYSVRDYQVVTGGEGFKAFGARVSSAVLYTLGVGPALGRFLTDQDDRENAAPVAILSDALWRERYASRRDVLGASIVVDGTAHMIVGVAPPTFSFLTLASDLVALPHSEICGGTDRRGRFHGARSYRAGRDARAGRGGRHRSRPRSAPQRLTDFFFGKGGPPVVHARRLVEDMTAPARPALSILTVAVALVLLIACANVTSLLLSRGVTRQRELAIRAAVGGSRLRIVRQLFTESAVFSVVGGALGLVLAWCLVRVLPAIAPTRMPRLDDVALDGTVVMFWLTTTLIAAVAAGLAPAARGARVDLSDALLNADRSSGTGFRGARARQLRDGLLVVEAAFAVVLIVGAGLLGRSFVRLMAVDNGYTANRVLIATVDLPPGSTDARTDQFISGALARLRDIPGVAAAGAGAMIPLMARTAVTSFALPESLTGGKPTHGRALVYWITPGYAEALGLRLRDGRFFEEADARAGNLTTIVNEEFLRQHLSAGVRRVTGLTIPNLVGQDQGQIAEIVGVVGNVLKDGTTTAAARALFRSWIPRTAHRRRSEPRDPHPRQPNGTRTTGARSLRQIEREAVVDRIEPLTTTVAASLDAPRFAAAVMTAFACVAIVLAAIGLYGALSYAFRSDFVSSRFVRRSGASSRPRAARGARRSIGHPGRHRAGRGSAPSCSPPHAGPAASASRQQNEWRSRWLQ